MRGILDRRTVVVTGGANGLGRANAPGPTDPPLLRTSPEFFAANEVIRKRMPLRRYGQPSEIGDAVAFLGSDLASFVTDTALVVDGSTTATF